MLLLLLKVHSSFKRASNQVSCFASLIFFNSFTKYYFEIFEDSHRSKSKSQKEKNMDHVLLEMYFFQEE